MYTDVYIYIYYIAMYTDVYIYIYVNYPPCNWGDPVGPLDSVEGPKVRYQMGQLLNQTPLSRLRSYFLQNQEPFTNTKSGKADFYMLQNQGQNFGRHQNSSLFELNRPG